MVPSFYVAPLCTGDRLLVVSGTLRTNYEQDNSYTAEEVYLLTIIDY